MKTLSRFTPTLFLTSLLLLPVFLNAQDHLEKLFEPPEPDEVKEEVKVPLPYDHIREADVMWSKTVWRVIDVREKMNLPFTYPEKPLIEVLHGAAATGEIRAYNATVLNADDFVKVLDPADVKAMSGYWDTITVIDPLTLQEVQQPVYHELKWADITKYRIKEQWFFDEGTSSMQVRIIGIAPVREVYSSDNLYMGDEAMYWLYFPEIRPILVNTTYMLGFDAHPDYSWDDAFHARLFTGLVYKENNVHDRSIQEYTTSIDMLLEAERIDNEIREFEHDLWSY